jgi:hypothetical protein
MSIANDFKNFGVVVINNFIPTDVAQFATHTLLKQLHHDLVANGYNTNICTDVQVENTLYYHLNGIVSETIAEIIWPKLEEIVGEDLYPTYSYARVYQNGNVMEKHTDRPSCEVSVSIQLGRSHDYAWPLCVENKNFEMSVGDAVLYKGCEVEHWREECKGPEGYYSGQLFCHFVRAEGPNKNYAGDNRWNYEIPYVRKRTTWLK